MDEHRCPKQKSPPFEKREEWTASIMVVPKTLAAKVGQPVCPVTFTISSWVGNGYNYSAANSTQPH